MTAANITIGTSIAPRDLDRQRAAVESWRALGFGVLSLNAEDEVRALESEFPGVTFVAARRTAMDKIGKPLIYLDDVLRQLWRAKGRIVGIVNSDVMLRAGAGFHDFVARQAEQALVFGHRVDVMSFDSGQGEFFELGFDYFFFDKSIVHIYPPSSYCLGWPWWDYWLPFVAIMSGSTTRRLASRVAFHPAHFSDWRADPRSWMEAGAAFAQYVRQNTYEKSLAASAGRPGASDDEWVPFGLDLANYCFDRTLGHYRRLRKEFGRLTPEEERNAEVVYAHVRLHKHLGDLSLFVCDYIKRRSEDIAFSPGPE